MQKKILAYCDFSIPWLYYGELLRRISEWPEKICVTYDWFTSLIDTWPVSWDAEKISSSLKEPGLFHSYSLEFYQRYCAAPALSADLLNFIEKKHSRLQKTKTGRLKLFIAHTSSVPWRRGFGGKPDKAGKVTLRELQDGEIAVAFEKSNAGETVTIADVVKARKWVAKQQSKDKKIAHKILGKHGGWDNFHQISANGFFYTKGRASRQK